MKLAPRTIWVDIDRDDYWFFDLTAKQYQYTDSSSGTSTSKTSNWINFERFEGYLTMVANVGKVCGDNTEDIEGVIYAMKNLFHVMPYSLNVLLFPFQPKGINNVNADCTKFNQAIENATHDEELKNKLFIMEEAILNGENAHPVYKYLKQKTELEPMAESHSTFFFVGGEGTRIDLFQGASFGQLRGHIVSLTRDGYGL